MKAFNIALIHTHHYRGTADIPSGKKGSDHPFTATHSLIEITIPLSLP
jgi:hypothetical protein